MKYANVTLLGVAVVIVVYSLSVTYGSLTATRNEPIEIARLSPSEVELPSLQAPAAVESAPASRRPSTSSRALFGTRNTGTRTASPRVQTEAPTREETRAEPETRSVPQQNPPTSIERPETNVINVGGNSGGNQTASGAAQRRESQSGTAPRTRSGEPDSSGGFAPAPPPFVGAEGVKRSGEDTGARPSPPPARGSMVRQRR